MRWVLFALGVVLVVTVLRDVFHTLLRPSGHGSMTRGVMGGVWRLCRLTRRWRRLSGPLGMVCVVVTWGSVTVLGWALVYLPWMPAGFTFAGSLEPASGGGLPDSLYLSLVAVATLGFGDIAPVSPVPRLLAPLEAVVGFMLFTAAVSWVLQVYPALTRRRVLSLRLVALHRAGAGLDASVLHELAASTAQLRVDLVEYGATYYFHDEDDGSSVALTLNHAADLADAAVSSADEPVRRAGATLAHALDDLARALDGVFLRTGGEPRAVLRSWAEEQ